MKLKKRVHPIYKKWKSIKNITIPCCVAKWQYISDCGKYSIIGPSMTTMGKWELYDGDDIWRFESLKDAKVFASLLKEEK